MKCGPNGLRWMDGDGSVPQSKGSHLIQTFFFPHHVESMWKTKYLSPIKMSECRLLRKLRNKNSGGFYAIDVLFQMFIIPFQIGCFVSCCESAYFIYPRWRNICFALNVTPFKTDSCRGVRRKIVNAIKTHEVTALRNYFSCGKLK